MSQKVLDEILGSLSQEEAQVTGLNALNKEAGYNTPQVTQTESGLQYPPRRLGPDSTVEKRLGLLGLTPGKHATEEMANSGAAGIPSTNAGTEGIYVPSMRVGRDSVLEKKAHVMSRMEELLGMDLEKTASVSDEETLEKLAYDTLADSLGNLDKIAMEMADVMADRFIDRVTRG